MLLKVLVFSFSRNKIGKQICNKNCSLKARACGEAVRTSPCSVISSLVLLLRDFTIIAQKESLLAGKRLLHLLAGVEYHKHVKCYNHRLFCFTVQNFVIKKRGNLLTPAANKFFLFFFPVSAFYAENFSKQISFNAHIWTKSKFLGLSVGVENIGQGNRNTFSRELQAWKILEKGNILFRKVSKSWRGQEVRNQKSKQSITEGLVQIAEIGHFKVMLHGTIRNDGFQHNIALQRWNNVATLSSRMARIVSCNVNFKVACETGLVLCRIALWDCFLRNHVTAK